MGLPAPVAELMFIENRVRPITGDIGFIGRQTTYLTEKALYYLAARHQAAPPANFSAVLDRDTTALRAHSQLGLISDSCLINFFGGKFFSIDVSSYENADLVIDLSYKIPEEHHNRFDFIYDGSCLDNIFNPAEAIMNMSRMLRPGGRIMTLNHATHWNGPYTCFSVGWFFYFFVANRYTD